jgi:hypothetical protein
MLYKEQNTKVYVRVSDIMINNPHENSGLAPSIRFNEEYAVLDPNGEVHPQGYSGHCIKEMAREDAATEFNLLDPNTGTVLGKATFGELQLMLFSLYFHVAEERDNAPLPNDPPVNLTDPNNPPPMIGEAG